MVLRRGFYYAQFWAIPVLPLWLLIGRGLMMDDVGWGFLVLLIACPILSLAMIAVMGVTVARRSVRRARMLSWADASVLTAWYLSIATAGVVASSLVAVLVVVLTLVAFWSAVWQLFVETRQRVNSAMINLDTIRVTVH